MNNKKVAIVTWYNSKNFGSQLQSYALYNTIRELGFDVNMIYFHSHPLLRRLYYDILNLLPYKLSRRINKILDTPRYGFIKQYLKEHYTNPTKQLRGFDAVVCGSDQIWAPNVFDPRYMLSFVPDEINKFSYAASIGLNEIPTELKAYYTRLLSRLANVSVREENGKKLLKESCGIESTVVLDPTLLLSAADWTRIEKEPTIDSPYIFCYFLNPSHNYRMKVVKLQQQTGYRVVGISENTDDKSWMQTLDYVNIGPREFLGLIHKANIVITDSYHCSIFSLHFQRPFISFQRFKDSDVLCQNSRIQQLDNYFNISCNIVNPESGEIPNANTIDYSEFEKKRDLLKIDSINYLKKALLIC